jgi:elongator complex protein 3
MVQRKSAQARKEPREWSASEFDPAPHRRELVAIVREIEAMPSIEPGALDAVLRRHPRSGTGFFSRAQIIAGYRAYAGDEGFESSESEFVARVRRRPVRSQSGVTPLTVLTKPFPCPGKCVYCPNDLRMPKSYLSDEPGAQRAANNSFDPYLQTWNRLAAFRATGHPTEKIELIVLGGTWSFYPEAYQIWFAKRCLDAMNDFGAEIDERAWAEHRAADFEGFDDDAPEGPRDGPLYNKLVGSYLRDQGREGAVELESATWDELLGSQRRNEEAVCRNVGFSVETRPDYVTEEEILRIRRLGCTKVQLGIQSLSDPVLDAIKRGHSVEDTRHAIGLLRRAAFKIHAHWMPNLLGSDPAADRDDFERLFADPDFRPDELKIYPCSLIESAELMSSYRDGSWRPYEHDELLGVLTHSLVNTPRYCRLTRVIRDISSDDIVVGNKLTNFRELAEKSLAAQGRHCEEIRGREIRGERFDVDDLEMRATRYETGIGSEVFLELVTPQDRIVAFLRLAYPAAESFCEEIESSALIREVHVYGGALDLGIRASENAQHRGLGSRLIAEAQERCRAEGYSELAVISAVGTRGYYRKLGFRDGALYQHFTL